MDEFALSGYSRHVTEKERLRWVDGLRGIAVLSVLIYHAVPDYAYGWLGVSLFFVLSGFCLSWGPLMRRRSGQIQWFSLRQYAIARCRRILPPYYAALAIYVLLNTAFVVAGLRWHGNGPGGRFSAGAVIAHALLIQNLNFHWLMAIDGPMWSLATEWQWYFLFPLVLPLVCRWPRLSLATALLLTVAWSALVSWPSPQGGSEFVPGRLFEFCAGIVAARIRLGSRTIAAPALLGGLLIGLGLPVVAPALVSATHIEFALCGLAFGSGILLVGQHAVWQRLCSCSPLVWMGVRSYSIYLIHFPILVTSIAICPAFGCPMWVGPLFGCTLAVAASVMFFNRFEQPWLHTGSTEPHEEAQRVPTAPRRGLMTRRRRSETAVAPQPPL